MLDFEGIYPNMQYASLVDTCVQLTGNSIHVTRE